MHNYVLTEKKNTGVQGTPHLRQPTAKSPRTKAQQRRVCVSATVLRNQKKAPFFD
jgi:hypothetical protein